MDIYSRVAKSVRHVIVATMLSLLLALAVIILGAEPWQWVLENVFGAENIRTYWQQIVAGQHDRLLQWVVIIVFVLAVFAFLAEPAREAFRRYRSPYGRFWTDKKLRRELGDAQRELLAFCTERESSTPDLRDALNFVTGAVPPGAVRFGPGSSLNSVFGQGTSQEQLRTVLNAQDNRQRYEQETRHIYERDYFDKVACALREAKARNLITQPDEETIVSQLLQTAPIPMFVTSELRRQAQLLGLCRARLDQA